MTISPLRQCILILFYTCIISVVSFMLGYNKITTPPPSPFAVSPNIEDYARSDIRFLAVDIRRDSVGKPVSEEDDMLKVFCESRGKWGGWEVDLDSSTSTQGTFTCQDVKQEYEEANLNYFDFSSAHFNAAESVENYYQQ